MARSGRLAVLYDQLDGLATTVVIRHQPVRQPQAWGWLLLMPATEVDGIEWLAPAFHAQAQLEVAFADDAPVQYLEFTIEQGLIEALPPWPGIAQGLGMHRIELHGGEFTITQ